MQCAADFVLQEKILSNLTNASESEHHHYGV